MDNPPAFSLDTFALLAYLLDEPAAARIEKLLKDARQGKCRLYLSIINLGEILYITERRGGVEKVQDALALLQ
jgi:ribonuclease VapC